MSSETYSLFSVSGGKFHRPGEPFNRANAFRSWKTLCGVTVRPLNYFRSDADANSHTGGRLALHLCKRCAGEG
jgi:hypothetical protein